MSKPPAIGPSILAGDVTQPAAGMPSGQSRDIWTIQALRFVAAFMVVVLHTSFYTSERLGGGMGLYSAGANGVRLFFVISGFVMIMSSGKLLDTLHGWRVFAMKRIVRIVPMYWLVTGFKVVTMLLTPALILHSRLDWAYIAKSFAFVPATNVDGEVRPLLGVGWTLNFEMFFYLLFTLALFVRARPVVFIAPILLILSGLSLIKTPAWPTPAYFLCNPIVLDFLAGMLIARWYQSGRAWPAVPSAIAVAVGLAYLFAPIPKPAYGSLAASLMMTLAAAIVIAGAVSIEPIVGSRLPRPVLFLGAASYSLYLIHPITAPASPTLLRHLGIHQPLIATAGGIGIALIAGSLAYLIVEMPITRILGAVSKRSGLFDPGQSAASALPRTDIVKADA